VKEQTPRIRLVKRAFQGWQGTLNIVASLDGDSELSQVVGTLCALRRISQSLNGRRQQADHNPYDPYNDQQLDQRIASRTRDPELPHCITSLVAATVPALVLANSPP
jgi:hypothetical protein